MLDNIFSQLRKRRPVAASSPADTGNVFFMLDSKYDNSDQISKLYVFTVDAEGKKISPDYHNYEGQEALLLKAIARGSINLGYTDSFAATWAREHKDPIGCPLAENPDIPFLLTGVGNIVDEDMKPIEVSDDAASILLSVVDLPKEEDSSRKYNIMPVVTVDGHSIGIPDMLSETLAMAAKKIYTVPAVGDNFLYLHSFIGLINEPDLTTYLSIFKSYFNNIPIEMDGMKTVTDEIPLQMQPTIVLEKIGSDKSLYMHLTETTADLETVNDQGLTLTHIVSIQGSRLIIRRIEHCDLSEPRKLLQSMISKSAPGREARKAIAYVDNFFIIPEETASAFLFTYLPEILKKYKVLGAEKLKEYKISPVFPKLKVRLSSGIDFLEGDADVEVGSQKISLGQLLSQYKKQKFVELSDGTRGVMDERYMKRLERIFRNPGKGDKVKVSFFDLPDIEDLLKENLEGRAFSRSRKVYEGFNDIGRSRLGLPGLKAKLRPYQKLGVKWLRYLYSNGLGGCLADDMGLGKTVQTIALFTLIYPKEKTPSLIVMPKSLLFNWEAEFAKFAPELKVATYYGPDRDLEKALEAQVVLTTYAIARNDIEKLMKINFHCIILDESTAIKNVHSQTAQGVFLLHGDHRFALSGTPIENNLTELYSLFRFLNPAMFPSLDDFNKTYTYPIQRQGDQDAMQSLRRKIYPFLLRRTKEEVLTDLPERIEKTLWVKMDEAQALFYNRRRLEFKDEINRSISESGIEKSQFVMFRALSELRRIASVPESLSDGKIHSPKIEALVEHLTSAIRAGHKIVVFFNFIAGIELVGEKLEEAGIQFETMTGATSDRRRVVSRFQSDADCKVLLMTLKVGGVGLNLTAADMVFIFEPWWNKAAEEQAVSRLHRMGQKSVVQSFSMITKDTIEEKILQLQQQKKELFDGLIGSDEASLKHLSEEEINFILS